VCKIPWWSLDIPEVTVGIDRAGRKSDVCILNARAEVIGRSHVSTTPEAIAAPLRTEAVYQALLAEGRNVSRVRAEDVRVLVIAVCQRILSACRRRTPPPLPALCATLSPGALSPYS
jgi:hypothetical protein